VKVALYVTPIPKPLALLEGDAAVLVDVVVDVVVPRPGQLYLIKEMTGLTTSGTALRVPSVLENAGVAGCASSTSGPVLSST
jgi:hypothetical protein